MSGSARRSTSLPVYTTSDGLKGMETSLASTAAQSSCSSKCLGASYVAIIGRVTGF